MQDDWDNLCFEGQDKIYFFLKKNKLKENYPLHTNCILQVSPWRCTAVIVIGNGMTSAK